MCEKVKIQARKFKLSTKDHARIAENIDYG